MRGRSGAHLLEADGRWYVAKFVENEQHRRIILNEWIGAHLMQYLGIESPVVDFLLIGTELSGHINASRNCLTAPIQPGIHIGSAFPGSPFKQAVYDFLPRSLIGKVQNKRAFWGALTVDKWASNTDGRQAVFTRPQSLDWLANPREIMLHHFVAACIDQGNFFGGPLWQFAARPSDGLHSEPAVYADITGIEDLEPWLTRISQVSEEWLVSLIDSIPLSWLENDREDLTRLLTALYVRRNDIADLVIQTVLQKPHLFPSWSGLTARKPAQSQSRRPDGVLKIPV